MSVHTPGPWTTRRSEGLWRVDAANDVIVADVYGKVDARLIAVAPDMLEALKAARVVCEAEGARATLVIVDAAIAKAEERS